MWKVYLLDVQLGLLLDMALPGVVQLGPHLVPPVLLLASVLGLAGPVAASVVQLDVSRALALPAVAVVQLGPWSGGSGQVGQCWGTSVVQLGIGQSVEGWLASWLSCLEYKLCCLIVGMLVIANG